AAPKTSAHVRVPPKPLTKTNGGSQSPIHSAITEIFQNDSSLRDAITGNLKQRSAETNAIAERAKKAFHDFSPSKYSSAERARPNYLGPTDKLDHALKTVVHKSIDTIRTSSVKRSIKFRLNEDLNSLIKDKRGKGVIGTADLKDVVGYITQNRGDIRSLSRNPAYASCKVEFDAEEQLKAIESSQNSKSANQDGGNQKSNSHTASKNADEFVRNNVSLQMATATSPESPLSYSVTSRPDQAKLQASIQSFELRTGASDVTSYHDFSSLQIAFEHVWTEIFHGQLTSLGQELYKEYVKLKIFTGSDDGDRKISTIDDLAQLMADIRNLSQITQQSIPGDLQPNGALTSDGAPVTGITATQVAKTALDPGSLITSSIGDKTVQTILDPAGAIFDAISALLAGKPQLTWASFPGPLPVNNDIITTSFEENAVAAGTVQIVLRNSPDAGWWKGIEFREYDATGHVINDYKISNDPQDTDVWDQSHYNTLTLCTTLLPSGLLEFKKAAPGLGFGVHTGYYLLAGLDQKMKDQTRVTFTWEKDS